MNREIEIKIIPQISLSYEILLLNLRSDRLSSVCNILKSRGIMSYS